MALLEFSAAAARTWLVPTGFLCGRRCRCGGRSPRRLKAYGPSGLDHTRRVLVNAAVLFGAFSRCRHGERLGAVVDSVCGDLHHDPEKDWGFHCERNSGGLIVRRRPIYRLSVSLQPDE